MINYEAIRDWISRDILARNYLVATIEHQQQRTLINCRSAHDMWNRLSAQHLQDAAENQHALQHRFYEYQYQPGHDIMSHITEIETMASRLSDVGAPMSDIQIMTKIICTQRPCYRNFATVWDNVAVNERTIPLLTTRLLKEESKILRWSRGQQDAADTASFARNYLSNANSSGLNDSKGNQGAVRRHNLARYRPYVKCSYCAKDWLTHEECRKRKRDELLAKSRQDNAAAAIIPPIQNSSLNAARSNNDASGSKQDHSYI